MTSGSWYLVIACLLLVAIGCEKKYDEPATDLSDLNHKSNIPEEKRLKGDFEQVNIVSDTESYNPLRIDPILQNAWGLAFAPSGPAWVNANETGMSAVFNTAGADVIPAVAIRSKSNRMWAVPSGTSTVADCFARSVITDIGVVFAMYQAPTSCGATSPN